MDTSEEGVSSSGEAPVKKYDRFRDDPNAPPSTKVQVFKRTVKGHLTPYVKFKGLFLGLTYGRDAFLPGDRVRVMYQEGVTVRVVNLSNKASKYYVGKQAPKEEPEIKPAEPVPEASPPKSNPETVVALTQLLGRFVR